MAGLTLDAGALIAAERGDVGFWALWRVALERQQVPTLPAPVLAQVWRGSPRQARLAPLTSGCEVEPLDEERARRVGVLCGRAGTADIVDAAVVLGALDRGDVVVTSDREDLLRLAGAVEGPLAIATV